ncbi:MAG: clan AA aspartic protease, partial [Crenarchaeota archaeon]|nr:clan AA aspartic protease [Thermoproteota archaeon]
MKRFLLFLLLVSLVITIGYLPVTATNDLADEIKEAKILNAYWVGDYQVPAFSSLKRNSFLIEIKFSEDNPSDVQIQNFFTKAGYHFQLKTKGQKSLSAIGYQYGNYKINDQNITGLWLFVDSKEIVNIKTDIPYELIPQKKNKKFRWIIKNKIIFRNLSEVKFSTYKDPITEFLSRGEPFGPKAVETIPFSFVNGFIIINARINNSEKEYRFIVDTGAGSIVIDDEVAAELKLEKKMDGRASDYYDSKAFDIVFIRRLTVGKVGVENCGAIVIDLKLLDDYQVDGLIGYNFLKF